MPRHRPATLINRRRKLRRVCAVVRDTLLHAPLDATSVGLMNAPSDSGPLASFRTGRRGARCGAVSAPSLTTSPRGLHSRRIIPGETGPGVTP